MDNCQNRGLSTQEALHILYDEIVLLRNNIKQHQKINGKDKLWIYDAFYHTSPFTSICWITALVTFISTFLLFVISLVYDELRYLFDDSLMLFVLLSINVALVMWDNKLRHEEMFTKLDHVLKKLNVFKDKCHWKKENYPHLCMPFSPSVTLQWTQRDGILVNLPWALLVKGDIVLLKPGQTSPCHATRLYEKDKWAPAELTRWEIFNPDIPTTSSKTTVPSIISRIPLKNVPYILNETPYLHNLKIALDLAQNRPCSLYTKCLYLLQIIFVQKFAAAFFLGFSIITIWWRWSYITLWLKPGSWVVMFIVLPISIIIPLLPLMLPVAWILLNCYGNALLQSSSIVQINKDLFEETETEVKNNSLEISLKNLWENFYSCILGNANFLHRSTNLLHVMGSVTALCCVDKKGILSWPNPTAEKVFFFKNSSKAVSRPSSFADNSNYETQRKSYDSSLFNTEAAYAVEVLDLTHDRGSAWRLQFDDASWSSHLSSLKPLGLAVLLNTCNPSTHAHYAKFCAHVSCQALYSEVLVPVTNRRCLCELARQIGFSESADNIFELQLQLSTYRHVQLDVVRRDIKFVRSLPITTKLKFPFPHMVCVGLRERSIEKAATGLQLFSQGTADIILDACIDYWDGHDLNPISPAIRKKVLDFYQRTSLTAYCTAFSYRPLPLCPDKSFSEVYLELPADCRHLYSKICRSPTPHPWSTTAHSLKQPQFHSSDSLLFGDCHYNSKDVNNCFQTQCNQIFLGMVTMQYQPQYDMVQLIELLEKACIRFVHFSKENELRSRVFSEKMGLESGWNCHISLLGDTQTRTRLDPSEGAATCDDETSFLIPLTSTSQSRKKLAEHEHNLSADSFPPLNLNCAASNMSRTISMSAPTALNIDYAQITIEQDGEKIIKPMLIQKNSLIKNVLETDDVDKNYEDWHSLSCMSDSTDQSVPVNFDMYNRAKLPRGIENIRPHLECIDNVPLLVSLFTDCTPEASKEMISIMQQYGEVVCVLGSSPNAENIGIFMQADASVGIEPIYPQVCQRISIMHQPNPIDAPISPISLSELLNSLPCCLSFNRQDPLPIYHLIMEARYLMQRIWNCVQFWTSCMVSLSFLQLLVIAFVLPPIFSIGQILWLVCIIIPILSISLVGGPTDPKVMQTPTGKNQCSITTELSYYVFWFYGLKFLPVIISMMIFFIWTLSQMCNLVFAPKIANSTTEIQQCWYVYPEAKQTEWGGWSKYEPTIISVQRLMLLFLIMHYIIVSLSFVHREYLMWKRTIHLNKFYVITIIIIIFVQFTYTIHYELFHDNTTFINVTMLSTLTFIFAIISLLLVLFVNEFIHWQEIRANVRYQKRARLDFGTKLGMNSPF